MMHFISLITGLATGWLSALLGIGGGIILVPVMVYLLKLPVQQAVGTSLMVIIPTAIVGAWKHYNLNHVNLKFALLLALGAVVGAYLGALTTSYVSGEVIRKLFAVLILITAVQMFIS